MKSLVWAALMAAGLTLTGCGGNNNTSEEGDMMPAPEPAPAPVNCGNGIMATPPATCAEKIQEANAANDAAKKKTADASALYAKLVTATQSGVPNSMPADGNHSDVKAEHKGIESLRGEDGQTWINAINENASPAGVIGNKIGAEIETGTNIGYYPLTSGPAHMVKADAFTKRVGQKHEKDASFSGSYRGISGMFKCTATDGCTSSPTASATTFDLPDNQWHFKPDSRTAKLPGAIVAEWGWWLAGMNTANDASDDSIQILYRHTGTKRATLPVAGEAIYTGKAHGQYAVVDGMDSISGAFEATAMLTAKFAGATGTTTKISGKIDDFNVGSNWEVMLKENAANHASGDFSGKTVWKTGDADGLGEGDWTAALYDGGTGEPTHAIGGFTATDAGSRMVGAFGAEPSKQ